MEKGSQNIEGLPVIGTDEFCKTLLAQVKKGRRISSYFAVPSTDCAATLTAVLADDEKGTLDTVSTRVKDRIKSLTNECPQVHLFEREIYEQSGILPEGHPWLKPVRFTEFAYAGKGKEKNKSGMEFFSMQGDEVHEVAVGPIHAGIIEPGHFRFQCHGETVYHLEIGLGYQHRGVESALKGGPDNRTLHYFETLAGDSTIGHATAGCRIIEALARLQVPERGEMIRGIAAELERIANHIGDIGAIAGDVGFLPTSSYCGRIRGEVLNLTAMICGNRFGRGLVIPGGTFRDITPDQISEMLDRLTCIETDTKTAIELMFDTPSVLARLENTGRIDEKTARTIGLVGPCARASGRTLDIRATHPYGVYKTCAISSCVETFGDCFARAHVRWKETLQSFNQVREWLENLPKGPVADPWDKKLGSRQMACTLTEGWRGEICHTAATDSNGKFLFYKIVDPSFHNWFGVSLALRNEQISDFPLCNKSFNLSYCGHDL